MVSKAAATGATAEDALDCLLAVMPKKGAVPIPQVGSLIGTIKPGGWAKNFSHLGSLQKFIEANPYYLQLEHVLPQPIVSRCDPEALAAAAEDPEPQEAAALQKYTAEEAVAIIQGLIPEGQAVQISQLGASLGGGGWTANKQFSHLAKNLQAFLLEHPDWFTVDLTALTVHHAVLQADGTPIPVTSPTMGPPSRATGPKATAMEAAAAILAVLPAVGATPLAQVGTQLGNGGWKLNFGHFGNLRSFVEANPELFFVDATAIATGGQALIARGAVPLEQVAEVRVAPKPTRLRPADTEELNPAKRVSILPRPMA